MDDLAVGGIRIPDEELEERFDTWGGPGGQHANRSQTAVTLRFDIAGSSLPEDVRRLLMAKLGDQVEVRAGESRSQSRNRAVARQRMADRLDSALAEEKPRKKTRPTRASRQKRLDEKAARSEVKQARRKPGVEE